MEQLARRIVRTVTVCLVEVTKSYKWCEVTKAPGTAGFSSDDGIHVQSS